MTTDLNNIYCLWYDFTACNNVIDMLCNTNAIASIANISVSGVEWKEWFIAATDPEKTQAQS